MTATVCSECHCLFPQPPKTNPRKTCSEKCKKARLKRLLKTRVSRRAWCHLCDASCAVTSTGKLLRHYPPGKPLYRMTLPNDIRPAYKYRVICEGSLEQATAHVPAAEKNRVADAAWYERELNA